MEHVAAGAEREEGVSIDDLEYLLEQLHTEVGLEAARGIGVCKGVSSCTPI
jgi:hypothetical protein